MFLRFKKSPSECNTSGVSKMVRRDEVLHDVYGILKRDYDSTCNTFRIPSQNQWKNTAVYNGKFEYRLRFSLSSGPQITLMVENHWLALLYTNSFLQDKYPMLHGLFHLFVSPLQLDRLSICPENKIFW